MRLQTFLVLSVTGLILCAFQGTAMAIEGRDSYSITQSGEKIIVKYDLNELAVDKLDGTVMVQHPGEPKPYALGTVSTVEKGDIITVYDKSWVIFKDHKGDRVGVDGNTTVSVDEFYIGGPDRQVRFLLQKGTLFLKTNNCDSKQSFFEVNTGSVVSSVGDSQVILTYDPDQKEHLQVQYLRGKLSVIDAANEYKFGVMPKEGSHIRNIKDKDTNDATDSQLDYIPEWSELNWEKKGAGPNDPQLLVEKVPNTIEEIVKINYNHFFNGEPRLKPAENNILLDQAEQLPSRYR